MSSFLRYWLPVLLWLALIAVGSGAAMSAEHTGSLLAMLLDWLAPGISDVEFARWHTILRKTGHVVAYAIGALLWFRAVHAGGRRRIRHALLAALLATSLVAAADEYRQSFLPERTGTARDLIYDYAGAAAGVAIIVLLVMRRSRRKAEPAA